MAIFRSLTRALGRSGPDAGDAVTVEELRDELVDRATRHEILAAQRTDLVVDQLWRRLEAADARLATALQRLEERVSALEAARAADSAGRQHDGSLAAGE